MRITIHTEMAEGKSTLAALIADMLEQRGFEVAIRDGTPERGDAKWLLTHPADLERCVASMVGREKAVRRPVIVETACAHTQPAPAPQDAETE